MDEERVTLQWEHGSCQALLSWRSAGDDPDTEHSGSPMISCTLGLRIESIRGEEVLSCGQLPPLPLAPPTEASRLATLRDVEGALYGVVQEEGPLPLPCDVAAWVVETVAHYVRDRAAGALQEQLPPPLIQICADVHATMHALDWEDDGDGEEEDDEGDGMQVLDGEDYSDDVDEEDDGGEEELEEELEELEEVLEEEELEELEEEEEEGVMHVDDDNCGLVLQEMEVAAAMASGEEGGGEEEDCPICLDRMVPAAEGRETCWMPCMHRFHRDCLWKWLLQYKGDCPLCRFKVGTLPSS